MKTLQPIIPVLSLPSAVLFPHCLLELKLTDEYLDWSAGEWLADGAVWGIATLRNGEKEILPGERPAIHRVLGVGCIVHREREKGILRRLVVEGMARGQVAGDCEARAAAAVQVEILRDHVNIEGTRRKELARSFSRMVRTARRLASLDDTMRDPIRRVLHKHPHPGVVADLLAHNCIGDIYARQCVLAELDVCRRVQLVQIQLARMLVSPTRHPLGPSR